MRVASGIVVAVLVSGCSRARPHTEPVETDRPDYTEAASVVGKGTTQLEAGTTWTKLGNSSEVAIGETLVRVGTGERTELRFFLNSVTITAADNNRAVALENPGIGTKVVLVAPDSTTPRSMPTLALLVATTLPFSASRADRVFEPEAKLAAGWDLSDRFSLGANANIARPVDEGRRYTELATSASLGIFGRASVGVVRRVLQPHRAW